MTGLPVHDFKVEVAFTSDATDTTPTWVDVTDWVLAVQTARGREDELAVIQPGSLNVLLDNSDRRFDADYASGPYFGYIRHNRQVRVAVQQDSGDPWTYLARGYADEWIQAFDTDRGNVVALNCTDRFKLLTKYSNTGTTVEEQADDRIVAILEAGGGAAVIIPSGERSINADGYACRTVVAYVYDGGQSTLQNLHDVALADGGAMFMDGEGVFVFQSTRFRTDNTRATVSQGTFGNNTSNPSCIPIENDISPTVTDSVVANYVTVTCGDGSVDIAQDATAIASDGRLEIDLGNTLLRALDGPDRVADVLLLRKDPHQRISQLTLDGLTDPDALEQAIAREISDRVTVEIIPPGHSTGTARDYYVESVAHDISLQPAQWLTTMALSSTGGAATLVDPFTFSDDFDRADSAVTLGGGWEIGCNQATQNAVFGISSNRAYYVSGGGGQDVFALRDVGVGDFDMTVTCTTASDAASAAIFWRVSADNRSYYCYGFNAIYKVTNGGGAPVVTGRPAITSGDVVRVVAAGTTTTVYINGSVVYTGTAAQFYPTHEKHGFGSIGSYTGTRWDDFSISF
jgi:hypothetical protein